MDTIIVVAIVVVALLALLAIPALYASRRRSSDLRGRFGPEYERLVSKTDNRRDAERELKDRQQRVEKLHLKELDSGMRQQFTDEWRRVQERFVDDPAVAVREADMLCERVMDQRGYPISDFERQAADISVDHAEVVTNYRAAHAIAVLHENDEADTEDLRQAMVHYRTVFAELLGATPARA